MWYNNVIFQTLWQWQFVTTIVTILNFVNCWRRLGLPSQNHSSGTFFFVSWTISCLVASSSWTTSSFSSYGWRTLAIIIEYGISECKIVVLTSGLLSNNNLERVFFLLLRFISLCRNHFASGCNWLITAMHNKTWLILYFLLSRSHEVYGQIVWIFSTSFVRMYVSW